MEGSYPARQPEGDHAGRTGRILLVEDDPGIGELMTSALSYHGHEVELAPSLESARQHLARATYDLAMLDVRLPDGSGLSLCSELRSSSDIPIIIVSVADSLEDRIAGFDAGADDYVTKPFYARELSMRVAALLRRSSTRDEELLAGPQGLQLDVTVGDAKVGERRVRLTRSEAGVLAALLRSAGSVVSAEEICRQVWRYQSVGDANFVQQHVSRLRRKLRGIGLPRDLVRTVYGSGYTIDSDGDPGSEAGVEEPSGDERSDDG